MESLVRWVIDYPNRWRCDLGPDKLKRRLWLNKHVWRAKFEMRTVRVLWHAVPCSNGPKGQDYIDGLAQGCGNSSALAVELPQSCTKSSIWTTSAWQWRRGFWLVDNKSGISRRPVDAYIRQWTGSSSFLQIMAWRRTVANPLHETLMIYSQLRS